MPDRRFFEHAGPFSLTDLAGLSGIAIDPALDRQIHQAAPLVRSDERSVSFLHDRRYLADLKATRAAAVFVAPAFAEAVPEGTAAIVTGEAQAAWARAAARLHPPKGFDNTGAVHLTAELEDGVVVGHGAVVGPGARIGRGTVLSPNCVIGPGVQIGRDCLIGPNAYVGFALLGDRVRIAAGAVIGEIGFGVAGSKEGAVDVPQLGRAILQDGVSVGANSCVDRGAYDDTVIGENTKLDNHVQVAHNVVIGRNCALAAQVGISGSCTIGDGVQFGGKVGVAPHLKIGDGARLAGHTGIMRDVPPGETWGGVPAKPLREFLREVSWIAKQAGSRDESH
jgi:UDP-3-O-[3-hydroxymyristoyl] glucosamine N-acyltransferase